MKSNCHILRRVGDLQDQEHIHQVAPLHRLEVDRDSLRLRVDNLQVPLGDNHKEGSPLGMVDKVPHQDSQDQVHQEEHHSQDNQMEGSQVLQDNLGSLQEAHRRDNHLGILDLRSQDHLGLLHQEGEPLGHEESWRVGCGERECLLAVCEEKQHPEALAEEMEQVMDWKVAGGRRTGSPSMTKVWRKVGLALCQQEACLKWSSILEKELQ